MFERAAFQRGEINDPTPASAAASATATPVECPAYALPGRSSALARTWATGLVPGPERVRKRRAPARKRPCGERSSADVSPANPGQKPTPCWGETEGRLRHEVRGGSRGGQVCGRTAGLVRGERARPPEDGRRRSQLILHGEERPCARRRTRSIEISRQPFPGFPRLNGCIPAGRAPGQGWLAGEPGSRSPRPWCTTPEG